MLLWRQDVMLHKRSEFLKITEIPVCLQAAATGCFYDVCFEVGESKGLAALPLRLKHSSWRGFCFHSCGHSLNDLHVTGRCGDANSFSPAK